MLQLEIIGNLGNDAEIKEFNGKKYVSMNVAHSEKKRDSNGSVLETTIWVSVLWYGDGGNLTQYLKRGCKVFVRGRLSLKTYQDKHRNNQIAVNVNANEVTLCGLKGESQPTQQSGQQLPQSQPTNNVPSDVDDDLPF